MPLIELSDEEIRDAAQAARLAASQARKDAATQTNARITATFAADAERYKRLAEKFETARYNLEAKRPLLGARPE